MFFFEPSPGFYRTVFKRKMVGTDVAAFQLNLDDASGISCVVDGDFGLETEKAVKEFQTTRNLAADGIAGLVTQQRLCVQLSSAATGEFNLPGGFAKSRISNESSFAVACISEARSDGSFDLGANQENMAGKVGNQEAYHHAYSVRASSRAAGQNARAIHDRISTVVDSRYLEELANGDKEKFKWQMAALNHNWPDAAEDIPRYGYVYEYSPARDDQFAQWIYDATAGALSTPRQWIMHYVQRATVYVVW